MTSGPQRQQPQRRQNDKGDDVKKGPAPGMAAAGESPPESDPIGPSVLLRLQRSAGNRAVSDLLTQDAGRRLAEDADRRPPDARADPLRLLQRHPKAPPAPGAPGHVHPHPTKPPISAAMENRMKAMADHEADRAALKRHIEVGRSLGDEQKIGSSSLSEEEQKRTANACEWIKEGFTKLFALTPTGDSTERLKVNNMDETTDEAWFPRGGSAADAGDIYSEVAPYNHRDLTDNANVNLDEDGKVTDGWNGEGYLAIMNARNVPQDKVWNTLRHEVQHDADKNREKEAAAPTAREEDLEGYKTEFRAYSYEGRSAKMQAGPGGRLRAVVDQGFAGLDNNKTVNKYGYDWTERQLAIFEHVWDGYDHTKRAWDWSAWSETKGRFLKPVPAQPSTKDAPDRADTKATPGRAAKIAAMQQKIVAYKNPDTEGFNKWDSVRVEHLYKVVQAVPDGTVAETDPAKLGKPPTANELAVKAVLTKIRGLRRYEAETILNEADDWKALVQRKFAAATRTAVEAALQAVR